MLQSSVVAPPPMFVTLAAVSAPCVSHVVRCSAPKRTIAQTRKRRLWVWIVFRVLRCVCQIFIFGVSVPSLCQTAF
jgi:hypothetical protein